MNNGGYIHQRQSLLEPFYVCWYTGHFSLIRAQRVVWYLYFHRYKNPNKTIRALQISITEKMGKHPKSENIWNVAEDSKAGVLKKAHFYSIDLPLSAQSQSQEFLHKIFPAFLWGMAHESELNYASFCRLFAGTLLSQSAAWGPLRSALRPHVMENCFKWWSRLLL